MGSARNPNDDLDSNDGSFNNSTTEQLRVGCTHTILTCIDFRLHSEEESLGSEHTLFHQLQIHLGKENNFRRSDRIVVPGACYGIVHGTEAERHLHLQYLDTSLALHEPEELIIIPHLNCGRYAGLKLAGREEELRFLADDVIETATLLRSRYKKLRIHGFVAEIGYNQDVEREEFPITLHRVRLDDEAADPKRKDKNEEKNPLGHLFRLPRI